jgi:hypothetical protein
LTAYHSSDKAVDIHFGADWKHHQKGEHATHPIAGSRLKRAWLAALWFSALSLNASAEPPQRLDGYGGYRFGLSFAEADALHADDVAAQMRSDRFDPRYLERKDEVFGEQAELLAMFDKHTQKLAAITLRFNRYRAAAGTGECLRLLRLVEAQFTRAYGTQHMIVATEPGGRNWHFPQGGVVSITNLCVGADQGAVSVSFRP